MKEMAGLKKIIFLTMFCIAVILLLLRKPSIESSSRMEYFEYLENITLNLTSNREDIQSSYSEEIIDAFASKILLNPIGIDSDPYRKPAEAVRHEGEYTGTEVCAIRYYGDTIHYEMYTFINEQEAGDLGFIVTHRGPCGTCSSLQDLAVYLKYRDLTTPVRKCCSSRFVIKGLSVRCLKYLGFSDRCAATWYYNALNTARDCMAICVKSWIMREPFNNPDGGLNGCLACDEENSGPIFKATAGRTRRNSGILSAIGRQDEEVYPMVHDYY